MLNKFLLPENKIAYNELMNLCKCQSLNYTQLNEIIKIDYSNYTDKNNPLQSVYIDIKPDKFTIIEITVYKNDIVCYYTDYSKDIFDSEKMLSVEFKEYLYNQLRENFGINFNF